MGLGEVPVELVVEGRELGAGTERIPTGPLRHHRTGLDEDIELVWGVRSEDSASARYQQQRN